MFAIEVGTLFERYDIGLVEYLCDVRNVRSLQRSFDFPPSIKELSDKLEDEAARRFQAARSSQRLFAPSRPVEPPRVPGYRANLLVPCEVPEFGRVKALVESGSVDPYDYRCEPDGSIRIAYGVWLKMSGTHTSTFKTFSDAELRALYGQREAEAAQTREQTNEASWPVD